MKRLVQLGCIGVLASATVLGGRAQELSPGPPTLPAGLVRARADIGQNILGASNFFSLNPGPPDAPSLEVWLNDTSNVAVHLNIFGTNLALLVGQTPSAQDEAIWQQFEAWVAALPVLAPGDSVPFRDRYVASLVQQGIARKEAERRYERVLVIRHGSVDRERVYWDGAFKSGTGPDEPLRLLQETIRKLKPGRALDAGMGRGRNSIFLASVGWDTTGYDISAEALKAARTSAEKAGVKIRTVQARHDTFPFGEAQWDLIVCAYCYIRPEEAQWPEVFWKALRPGGVVVYQTFVETPKPVSDLIDRWRRFRVLRVEDLDAGVVDDDWTISRTNPTIKLVARKE